MLLKRNRKRKLFQLVSIKVLLQYNNIPSLKNRSQNFKGIESEFAYNIPKINLCCDKLIPQFSFNK